ncbi:MAG TPA: cation transporter [Patescibacteria group bacterium]|nr:cation transporter [Patescibacteria group bacterium]
MIKKTLATKRTYKIEGMDCVACASLIEMDLEDIGVKASCSYPKELLEVEFDAEKVKEEQIKTLVNNSGFKII